VATRAADDAAIYFGVAGHRQLAAACVPTLETLVLERLQWFRSRLPGRPLQLLCGMAEGADLLVARAALAAGYCVRAVLAMPVEDFKTDFSESGWEEFSSLLPRCDAVEVVADAVRPACYESVANVIADRAEALLLLWDGLPARGAGGTAEVLQGFACRQPGEGEVRRHGLVVHILAPRAPSEAPPQEPVCEMWFTDDDARDTWRELGDAGIDVRNRVGFYDEPTSGCVDM
jgi:hypothetical protein